MNLSDAEVIFHDAFFDRQKSDAFFKALYSRTPWREDSIRIFGKRVWMPRLTAWYADEGLSYTYSGLKSVPLPWTPVLLEIKNAVETAAQSRFNSVLLNLYRDERDSVSWHSDDEPELGERPVIASVSLGRTRRFQMKHKEDVSLRRTFELTHGSLLLMKGSTQDRWLHQVPKESRPLGPRINLTFRKINLHTA